MKNIDKALEVLDKEVTSFAMSSDGIKYNSTQMLMALQTIQSWVQAVKNKFNAPMEDEY